MSAESRRNQMLPHAPDPDHPLMVAARYNDAEAEDHGLEGVVEKHGLKLDDLIYVAEQRAMRIVLINAGRLAEVSKTEAKPILMNREQREQIAYLTSAYLDAIFLGWRAHQLAE